MKILMISNHLGVQSGVQRYVQNLLLHLDTAKYRVTLFVGQCPPDQASTAPALEAHGVEILAVPDNKKDRIRALAAHLRTHKDYDIIHYHTASKIGAPVCGMMRVLCPRAKIVVHSHIVYPPMTLTWRAAHLVYQLFADYFLGCGVAAGRFVFGDHIDAKPNFSVACNAVDAGRFHPDAAARAATRAAWGITDTDRLAGFVGRLNHQKNPLFLMEVFAAMAAQDPHWKLLLVGTGEMEPEMRAAAARRGLTDRVIFAGVQSDVPAFMNAFDLFLLPSNFEGSPVTLVEAQGCGVPEFDLEVSAQDENPYKTMEYNQLALQLFQMGFFREDMADQALRCLELMDFKNKDQLTAAILQGKQQAAMAQTAEGAASGGGAVVKQTAMERMRQQTHEAVRPR